MKLSHQARQYNRRFAGGVEPRCLEHSLSTLLGPEGSVAPQLSFNADPPRPTRKPGRRRYRPLLENCTVDASIFVVK